MYFKDSIDDEVVLVNILRVDFYIFLNYAWALLMAEQIDLFLFLWNSICFLLCQLQLN